MKVRAKEHARTTVHYDRQNTNKQPNHRNQSPNSHIQWLQDQPLSEDPGVSPNRYWRKKIFQNKARSELPVSTNVPIQYMDGKSKSPNPQFILDDLGESSSQLQNPFTNQNLKGQSNMVVNNQTNFNQFQQAQMNYQSQNFVDKQRVDRMEESFHRNKRMASQQQTQTDKRIGRIEQEIKLLSQQFSDKVQYDAEFQDKMISIMKRKDQALLGKQHQVNQNLRHIMDLQENQRYYRNEIQNLKNQIAHEKRISELSKENQRLYQKIIYGKPKSEKINLNQFRQHEAPSKDSNYSFRDNGIKGKNKAQIDIQSPKSKVQITNLSPQKYSFGVQSQASRKSNVQAYNHCVLSPFSVDTRKY